MTKFIPKVGEKFHYIYLDIPTGAVQIESEVWEIEPQFPNWKSFKSNIFRTKKEAQEAARKIKKILKND